METDDSQWGWLEGEGIEQKGKRTHGHEQECSDCCGERGIRDLNGNGKKYNKIKFKIGEMKFVANKGKYNTLGRRNPSWKRLCLIRVGSFDSYQEPKAAHKTDNWN